MRLLRDIGIKKLLKTDGFCMILHVFEMKVDFDDV